MNNIEALRENVKDLKVLFVDDEKDIRSGTGLFLRKFFNNVVVCSDGEEGLNTFLKDKDFDLVITDIMMPKMDGVTMVKKIKEIDKDIFTVFITASRLLIDVEKDLSNFTLKKPISFEDIVMIMQEVVTLK